MSERDLNTQKLIDELMVAAPGMERNSLSASHVSELVADLFTPRWLLVQKFILEEINGDMVKLTAVTLTPEKLPEFAKIQGRIEGMRRFWGLLQGEIEKTQIEEVQRNAAS